MTCPQKANDLFNHAFKLIKEQAQLLNIQFPEGNKHSSLIELMALYQGISVNKLTQDIQDTLANDAFHHNLPTSIRLMFQNWLREYFERKE